METSYNKKVWGRRKGTVSKGCVGMCNELKSCGTILKVGLVILLEMINR